MVISIGTGDISIHALLAESDQCSHDAMPPPYIFLSTLSLRRATVYNARTDTIVMISIHALLAESDAKIFYKGDIQKIFLSTLSLRRATQNCKTV